MMQTCSRSCFRGLGGGRTGVQAVMNREDGQSGQPPPRNPGPQAFNPGTKVQDVFHACEG